MRDEMKSSSLFPDISDIDTFLQGLLTPTIETVVEQKLFAPATDILTRPSKRFRASLVEIGFRLIANADGAVDEQRIKGCELLGNIIEIIHAGSLVVDDIHDQSRVRRADTTLHLKYGISVALNTGNWLYFWPLLIVNESEFTAEARSQLYTYIHKTFVLGHIGQALDTGIAMTEVPQHEAIAYCTTSMTLKSGALVSLALIFGGIAAGASPAQLHELDQIGRKLGLALQMFDDIGNALAVSPSSAQDLKKQEDLDLMRPSWVWATVAKYCDQADYQHFVTSVKDQANPSSRGAFLKAHDIGPRGKQDATAALDFALSSFPLCNESGGRTQGRAMLEDLIGRMKIAYG